MELHSFLNIFHPISVENFELLKSRLKEKRVKKGVCLYNI